MADARIMEISGTKSATGGAQSLDYIVKWYFVANPNAVKVKEFLNMPPDDFENELTAYGATETATFI